MADITNEPVGIVDNKGAWPRGDLNEKGRRLPHGTLLYAHPKEDVASPFPPDSVVQALQAWADDLHKDSRTVLLGLIEHFNLEVDDLGAVRRKGTTKNFVAHQVLMFKAFYRVQLSGIYNMHDERARLKTGLTQEEYDFVRKNYSELREAAAKAGFL